METLILIDYLTPRETEHEETTAEYSQAMEQIENLRGGE